MRRASIIYTSAILRALENSNKCRNKAWDLRPIYLVNASKTELSLSAKRLVRLAALYNCRVIGDWRLMQTRSH